MAGELDGQVAIVTGGGRGIGQAIAQALAAAGAAVAVAARSADQLQETVQRIEAARGRALAVPTDITDREAVEQLVAATERRFGPVDLLVNNAGGGRPGGPFATADPDGWWRTLEIHLKGAMLCARAVVPGMVQRRRGRIITVASIAAILPSPYLSAYAAKAAQLRFTDSIAMELREHGVFVFAIHPGLVRTAMTEGMWQARHGTPLPGTLGKMYGGPYEDIRVEDAWKPPEQAAKLCVLLAGGQADRLTGRFFRVYDDLQHLVERADEIEQQMLYTLRLPTLHGIERPTSMAEPPSSSSRPRDIS